LRVPVRLLQAALTGTTREETLSGCGCRSLREAFERYSTYGTPERVAEFLRPYVTAGCSAINVIPAQPARAATDSRRAVDTSGGAVRRRAGRGVEVLHHLPGVRPALEVDDVDRDPT
jgi:hypothetical protein